MERNKKKFASQKMHFDASKLELFLKFTMAVVAAVVKLLADK